MQQRIAALRRIRRPAPWVWPPDGDATAPPRLNPVETIMQKSLIIALTALSIGATAAPAVARA